MGSVIGELFANSIAWFEVIFILGKIRRKMEGFKMPTWSCVVSTNSSNLASWRLPNCWRRKWRLNKFGFSPFLRIVQRGNRRVRKLLVVLDLYKNMVVKLRIFFSFSFFYNQDIQALESMKETKTFKNINIICKLLFQLPLPSWKDLLRLQLPF